MYDTFLAIKATILRPGAIVPTAVPAMPVDPSRVSLPMVAATCDPCEYLSAEQSAVFERLDELLLPLAETPAKLPKSCHWISATDEKLLRRKLVEIGLAIPIPVSEASLDPEGRILRAGLFAVPHKAEPDRMIVDRRAANALERRLQWCTFPHGSQLALLRL